MFWFFLALQFNDGWLDNDEIMSPMMDACAIRVWRTGRVVHLKLYCRYVSVFQYNAKNALKTVQN